MRAVLTIPAYRRLLAAYTLNELTWAFGSLALAVLVYQRTGSAVGASAYFLCAQFAPAFAAPALVAALDRFRAARVLPALYAVEAVAFLVLAWLAANFHLVPVLVITVLDGVVALAARAIARSSAVAVTSARGLLREGNALANAAFSVCYMAAPALGGVVVVSGGTSLALLVNSGLFAAIALVLASGEPLPGGAAESEPRRGRLRAALVHARERPGLRTLLGLEVAALLCFTIPVPVEVVLAAHTLHSGAGGYGALLSFWGGGAVLGSAVYARWRAAPHRRLIALGSGALGVGFAAMAAAPSIAVALAGAAVAGGGNGVWAVSMRTAVQEEVSESWMAVIMSLNESIFQAVPGGGIAIGGALAAVAGARVSLAIGGAGSVALAGAAAAVLGGVRGTAAGQPARSPVPQRPATKM